MRSLGIDIGSYSAKFAEVEASRSGGIKLIRFYEVPFDLNQQSDNRIAKLEALKQVVSQYDPARTRFVVGFGSENVSSRMLSFPFQERRKILSTLPFDLEDAIPFSQKDSIFDFKTISLTKNASTVLAMAAHKKRIKETLDLCLDAGLDPDIISPDGIALNNLFENILNPDLPDLSSDLTHHAKLVINLGYTKTSLSVVVAQSVIVSRTVLFGGRDFAAQISKTYNLPFQEALKAVAEKGFFLTTKDGATPDQVAFSDVLAQTLQALIIEIQKTMAEVKSEHKVQFESGVIFGGLSQMINLGAYLTSHLNVPCNALSPLSLLESIDIASTIEVEKASATAIGLAIEGLRKPRFPAVNFRKGDFSKQGQNFKLIWQNNKPVILGFAAVYVLLFIYSIVRTDFATSNLEAVEAATRSLSKSPILGGSGNLKSNGIKNFIKDKKNEIAGRFEVSRLNKTKPGLQILKTLTQQTPGKEKITLDVKEFILNGDTLTVQGEANSKQEVDSLQNNWSRLDFVTKLSSQTPTIKATSGKIAFSFAFSLKRTPSAAAGAPL